MKRMILYILTLHLAGCAGEVYREPETAETPPLVLTADDVRFLEQLGQPTALSDDETAGLIDEVVGLLDTSLPATRYAAAPRTAASIRPLFTADVADAATRGGASSMDTLLNVVDFADGRGYCVVAADRRIPQRVICFVGDGSFPVGANGAAADTLSNPGFGVMLHAMEAYALRSVKGHTAWCDSVQTSLLTRVGAGSIEEVKASLTRSTRADGDTAYDETNPVSVPIKAAWRYHRSVAPMLPVEWSQQSPFNATVVANTEWKSTPVGCVALATAGIMAYWRHPVSYRELGGGTIDWSELTRWSGYLWNRSTRYRDWDGPMTSAPDETRKLVADLLWNVAEDVDMDYGASVSLAYTSKATELLASLGFSQSEGVLFAEDVVTASLDAARPLIISGASHKLATSNYYTNSHAWVLDGYIEQRWFDSFTIDHHFYECEQFRGFFHSNFGWGGLDNGYYAAGLFDTNSGADLPSNFIGEGDLLAGVSSYGAGAEKGSSDISSDAGADWLGDSYNYQFNIIVYPNIYK